MIKYLETGVLFGMLSASVGLAFGLTRIRCYATICPEDYFPFQVTIHIAVYYGMLAVLSLILLLRAHIPAVRSVMGAHVANTLPIVRRRVTLGGLLSCAWVVGLAGAATGVWLSKQLKFWGARTGPLNWASAKIELTLTGVTGHYADIMLGLLLLPTSRFSLIGRAFALHQSTLLLAHKIIAYAFILFSIIHGGAYMSFESGGGEGDKRREEAFASGNPVMTLSESKKRSSWFTQTMNTGIAAVIFFLIILFTSLSRVRRNHYNLFYYTHVILGTAVIISASLHASTDFYLVIPGLLLWLTDRLYRLWAVYKTHQNSVAMIENAGHGWVRISVGATPQNDMSIAERDVKTNDPLEYYYLSFPVLSRLQNHAFTAAIPATSQTGPRFLLQPTSGKSSEKLYKEWTWKLRSQASNRSSCTTLYVDIQGPYPVHDDGYKTASHIVCIVGGTGVTGACSLVHWWLGNGSPDSLMTVIWAIRERKMADVREWHDLWSASRSIDTLSLTLHVSSENGRLEAYPALQHELRRSNTRPAETNRAWVYASGPDGLLRAAEKACVKVQQDLQRAERERMRSLWSVSKISWYMAKWEV
ncbi:hypothetical protein DM02DRAFT_720835 [Periconia macrospinosa]|uniref:Ferric oxidoreductase domain-containing protein n=1 Tax=Periconia macrospinosa TaxID=97972 RepID=A0A2V1DB98_9PLEO|nr:hypothetical protein DM02DRAFT_720835 [Periconia macrospinosa]